MSKIYLFLLSLIVSSNAAYADFQRWSAESTKDPFTGGERVEVSQATSMRSGVWLTCDTSQPGLEIKVVAGWAYTPDIASYEPTVKIAIDGEILDTYTGAATGAYGDNIAGISLKLDQQQSDVFLERFIASQSQIAIQDGISSEPHLLTARGSTKSGQQLIKCLSKSKQPTGS